MYKMKKRILSLATSLVVAATMIAGSTCMTFAEDKVEAKVTVRAQMAGGYLHGLETVTVSSDLAEKYGFTDNVPQSENVSALDALVKSHEMVFGDDFSSETVSEYLVGNSSGYMSKVYGYETFGSGFLFNGGFPNDGTESSWGGYNGTTVSTQKVVTGDVVDFYVYNDEVNYGDCLGYVDMAQKVIAGSRVKAKLSGTSVMSAYLYKDAAAMKAAAKPLAGVKAGFVNISSGSTETIDAVSDENGNLAFTAPSGTGTYYITACNDESTPVIMNPVRFTVVADFGSASLAAASYTYSGKAKTPSVTVKDKEGISLVKGRDYTVSYKNNTKVGTASATVKGTGIYSFSKVYKFRINPPKTKLVKVSALGGKKIKVSWKKQKTQTTGYQIRYSSHKNMSGSKKVTIKKNSITWKNIWRVGKGRKYVQIRTYKTVDGTRYYSSWSAAKTVKVK